VSVVVGDIAPAPESIIEVGPVPAAIPGLAASMESVATEFDVLAARRVGPTRQSAVPIPATVSVAAAIAVAAAVAVSVSIVAVAAATKLAIDVHNPAAAVVNIVERSPNPAAFPRLASGTKYVANHVNGSAGLDVIAGALPGSPAALEMPVVIDHFPDAMIDIVQRRPQPASVGGLAFRSQGVAAHAEIAAGFSVGSAWQ
jgi:D-alanyl-D-alanine dipeptidase